MSDLDVVCSAQAYGQMEQFAAASYPDEGCVVLVGRRASSRTEIVAATSAGNLNTERSRDRYLMDPADILAAERQARLEDLEVVGFWHSHPDHPASPSQYDTDHAWTDYVYIICATTPEGTGDVNAFSLGEEHGPFAPLLLIVAPQEPAPAP
jgi:proteasome lid subunit RPN8/RPN11